ncbi:hypothetical protein [Actomonas aquatica]|uniref:Uncharacterized protein n=1 Tax=Actomonas aquatica TaxID=2866162 RepID=A0ABZ1C2G2_9BACT|nr:hypothetical protein [Opitutus sp. WL0086]WRQ85714.1 hypothetical protein K1X11_012950 [Opitutus sp. WL0086]
MHRRLFLLSFICLALAGRAHAESRWDTMGVGLSTTDVAAALGSPLIVHGGHGFEQWTFDHGGTVMFHNGAVMHWNTPRGYRAPSRQPLVASHMAGLRRPDFSRFTKATAATAVAASTPETTKTLVDEFDEPPAPPSDEIAPTQQQRVRVPTFDELAQS